MSYPMHCFKCDTRLERHNGESFNNPPYDATYWRTYGNYGSTVYDDPDRQLEIYICDECLKKSNRVYEVVIETKTKVTGRLWNAQ